eukprot:2090965-Rhodomonas_salina.2
MTRCLHQNHITYAPNRALSFLLSFAQKTSPSPKFHHLSVAVVFVRTAPASRTEVRGRESGKPGGHGP